LLVLVIGLASAHTSGLALGKERWLHPGYSSATGAATPGDLSVKK
jgi:hypothetical protein